MFGYVSIYVHKHPSIFRTIHVGTRTKLMAVHLASTNDIGSRAAVEAPARRPDGTWNIKLTVAVFRPWRGSQATIASDPAFDAALRFARPHRCLSEEFGPAIAGCW